MRKKPLSLTDLPKIRGSYRENADLSKINWFQIGGPAEVMFRPADEDDLAYFLAEIDPAIPTTILGVGSNILVRDGGIDGVVIRLGREFAKIQIEGSYIHAGAGALCFNVAMVAADHGLAGLEFLSGIPGGIGGSLQMNAGAYGGDISGILSQATALDYRGNRHLLTPEDIGYVYRGNCLPEPMIFTHAIFKSHAEESPEILKKKIQEISDKRAQTQPIRSRTSGSTFKNPPDHKAWELIDKAGCRGLQIGDAQVSELHCNFFLNKEGATAKDIEELGEEVRRRVKENCGIELEWEVQIIGNPL